MLRSIFLSVFVLCLSSSVFVSAQMQHQDKDTALSHRSSTPSLPKTSTAKNWVISDLKRRSNDHLIVDFGYMLWTGDVKNLKIQGFNHTIGLSAFYDIPFRGNPHFSIAPGLGIHFNRVYFNKVLPQLGGKSLVFKDLSAEAYGETNGFFYTTIDAALEARYISNPARSERSFKVAVGIRGGLSIDALSYQYKHMNSTGTIALGTQEIHDNRFMQFPQVAFTLRIGYGVVGLFGTYQVTHLFTPSSEAPSIIPVTFGIFIGGL